MIGIIDYRAGNAPSVANAFEKLGIAARLIATPKEIEAASKIILPGVGSAGATMDSLRELDCIEVLTEKVIRKRTPFLGICVGLQILFEHSEEGDTDCLGWLPGSVKHFPQSRVRVPQIGWNKVVFVKEDPILKGLSTAEYFYFVNSYYVLPKDSQIHLGKTEYGLDFCAMIVNENIIATQFHIEKSGEIGLRMLKNFAGQEGGW